LKKYDLIVVGSGAGLMVLEAALVRGMRCAIIEKSKFGGTCLTKGCIPSKMLVYPADLIRETQNAKRVGLHYSPPLIDWNKISERMWKQINYHETIEKKLLEVGNLTVYKGSGEFTNHNTLKVNYNDGRAFEYITAERFVIAAGARSFVPVIDGLEESGYLTSETFFGDMFPKKPWKSLVIVGGGPIGAEFAHIFSSIGTKVTIIDSSDRLLKAEEEEISNFVRKQFENNGINVITNANIISIERQNENKLLNIEDNITKEKRIVVGEEIFIATGVQSNGDSLRLDRAGINVDKRGWIVTNEYLETSRSNIWAIGDINGKFQFRHKANYEAEILVNNIFGDRGERKKAIYNAVPWAVYTHPQVSHVGITEREAKERGITYHIGRNYYSKVVGGIKMGYNDREEDNGFVKLIVGNDRKLLGAHVVGPHAAMLVQPFVYLMNIGWNCLDNKERNDTINEINELRLMCPSLGTYEPILDSMVIHPSLNELTAWAFENLE
jgi:dihydrolipoamide dehydrogenase